MERGVSDRLDRRGREAGEEVGRAEGKQEGWRNAGHSTVTRKKGTTTHLYLPPPRPVFPGGEPPRGPSHVVTVELLEDRNDTLPRQAGAQLPRCSATLPGPPT